MDQNSSMPTRVGPIIGVWIALIGTLLLGSAPASAFGPMGHAIVGEIATPLLCESALVRFAAVSGERDLATAGLWADRIRDLPEWRHTLRWHYVDIGDDAALVERQLPPGGDLLTALSRSYDLLRRNDRKPVEQREALLLLIHLVADLHQPLHVGRPGDYGGNSIALFYRGTSTNLHRLWDGELLQATPVTAAEYAWALAPLRGFLAQQGGVLDVLSWAEESRALRRHVYAATSSRPVSRRYELMARTILHRRLVQAGARLARLLNDLYCRQ